MKARRWVYGLGWALALAGAAGALEACGGGGAAAKFASTKGGEMPANESWDGVYFNPVYGYLHLVPQGENVIGRWKRADSSHWGEMSGTVDGNVFHFTWTEHRYGAIGPSGDVHGSGIFVYKVPPQKDESLKTIPELDGKYALDDSQEIGDWHCVKQLNLKPDLNSITGENPSDPTSKGDQWQ
jgi:hypothetical protein